MNTIQREKTKDMMMCAMFVSLIAVGAFIPIPIPVIPFTLQLLFTTLAGLILGGKKGFIAVCVYIALGLIGVPVFAEGGGLGYIFKPSFGYLIGFAVGTYVTGMMAGGTYNPGLKRLLTANFTGLIIVYSFGMIYCYIINNFYLGVSLGVWPLFLYCFVLAVPGDILLCIIAAILAKRLIPLIKHESI